MVGDHGADYLAGLAPERAAEPGILARRAEIAFGAQLVLYPAPGDDHSALALLLAGQTDARVPAAADLASRPVPPDPVLHPAAPRIAVRWAPAPDRVEHFTRP